MSRLNEAAILRADFLITHHQRVTNGCLAPPASARLGPDTNPSWYIRRPASSRQASKYTIAPFDESGAAHLHNMSSKIDAFVDCGKALLAR